MNRKISLVKLSDPYGIEPVTVNELRAYLQVEGEAYDSQFSTIITQARGIIERACNVSLIESEVKLKAKLSKDYELDYSPVLEVLDVRYRKCPVQVMPAVEGTDYVILYDTFVPLQTREWFISYITVPTTEVGLIEAVKIQAAWMYTNRDADITAVAPQARVLVDAYKTGNY
jgi:hypothetical protein